MNDIKLELGRTYNRDEPSKPKVSFSAEFEDEKIALDFMGKLNSLVQNFYKSLETFELDQPVEKIYTGDQ